MEFLLCNLGHHINQHPYFKYIMGDELLRSSRQGSLSSFDSYSIPCEETCGIATENLDPKRVKRQTLV